ncbi:MAG: Uma2 family endonuclease [Acidobacteriota bacterium]|nr:Uma2 family endonuclease [Acidobacteriota bacterium]
MNITVEKTMEMPNAVLFARKLDAALKAEQKKRQHFYKIIDENRKMEFINGEILFQSPVKLLHNEATGNLFQLLKAYVSTNKLRFVGIEKILVSLTRNDYEPDVCFFGNEKSKSFTPKQMQFPAPDFVVEVVSDSTERTDRETKFQDYAAHGVREYWIVDPDKATVEQYLLQSEEYELLLKAKDGEIESIAIEGFRIPIRGIFDEAENLAALRTLIAD